MPLSWLLKARRYVSAHIVEYAREACDGPRSRVGHLGDACRKGSPNQIRRRSGTVDQRGRVGRNTGGLALPAGIADPYSLKDNGMRRVDWRIAGVETHFE